MYPGGDGKPDPSTTERFLRESNIYPGVKIAEGPDGYLYYADLLGENFGEGSIHRIGFSETSPTARLEANLPYGLYDSGGDFETTLDASKSSDPNQSAASLTYEWDLDEDGVFESSGSAQTKTVTFTQAEQEARENADPKQSANRVVAVRVKDADGSTSVARVTVYPGDKPPTVTITSPLASEKWSVGDTIDLNAKAFDAKNVEINTPLPYYWVTRMAHCPNPAFPEACHVHPLQTFSGIRHAEFTAPQHEYPSYIQIVLRVSDKRGLSGTASLNFQPNTVGVSLQSVPAGIPLLAGTEEAATPFAVTAIDGSEIQITAPATAEVGGKKYAWQSWSDGGPIGHAILAAGSPSFTATYAEVAGPPSGGGTGSSGGSTGGDVTPPPPPPTPKVPDTKLGRHPLARTAKTTATFTFSASVAGATFSCKLDGKPKAACGSPKAYKKLKPGKHTFKVWASAGVLTDPAPAKFSWKVLPPKR